MSKLIDKIKESQKQQESTLIAEYASVMNSVLTQCVDGFEEFLLTKYRKGLFRKLQIERNYEQQVLRSSLESKAAEDRYVNLLDASKSLTEEVLNTIIKTFKNQFVFVSSREIRSGLQEDV